MTEREKIVEILVQGPQTVDGVFRELKKRGTSIQTLSTVRRLCGDMKADGEVGMRLIKTKKHRNGISVWHHRGTSVEAIAAFVERLSEEARKDFRFGGVAPSAIDRERGVGQ